MENREQIDSIRRDRAALERALVEAGLSNDSSQKNKWHCLDPFHKHKHGDAKASGYIYQESGSGTFRFRCPVCGLSGDVFDFTQRTHCLDFAGAKAYALRVKGRLLTKRSWYCGQHIQKMHHIQPGPWPLDATGEGRAATQFL